MTNDTMLGGVYILMAMMLVLGSLMARREPGLKLVKMALGWVLIFGAGFILWIAWIIATLPGFMAGALVTEPARYGIDLVMPIFFSAMIVPLWKGFGRARPWAVAGVVALAVEIFAPGYLFIVAGALAGALTGALLENADE